MDPALTAHGIHGDNMPVVELGRRLSFILEALQLLRVQRRREREYFHRDAAAQGKLFGLVNDPHTAPADLADKAVVTQQDGRMHFRPRATGGICLVDGRQGEVCRRRPDELQPIQAFGQPPGDLGVSGEELLAIRPVASLQSVEVLLHRPGNTRIIRVGG
jgi:hypothetical protein